MGSSRLRRLLHPVYRRLETYVHPLRYLFVELTQRCNLECRHCGSDCGRRPPSGELSTQEWLDLFAYLPRHFDPASLVLVLTGGEPFCHPELDRLIAGLRANRLRWGMVTNGWALDDRGVRRLVDGGASSVTVSLDGLAERHDWLRATRGSFDRAVVGIERLAREPLRLFDVVTCVHAGNLEDLPHLEALLAGLGVPAWRLFAIFPRGRARNSPELLLDTPGWRRLFDFIRKARARRRGRMSINFSCEAYLPAEVDREVRDEPYFCRAGISIGSVLSDGSIAACPNISRELVQGNIREDDFATVWRERYGRFRNRGWMRTGECRGCREFRRCQGNSMHLWDPAAGETSFCARRVLAASGGGAL